MNDDLLQRLTDLASSPVLLVASDFDGTLAAIVSRPELARADASAADAIGAIARLDHSHAAVISGRERDELSRLCGDTPDLWLVGSHGAEFPGFPMPPFDHDDLARVAEALERSAESRLGIKSGAVVERKPAGVAFHYRRVPAELAGTARQLALEIAASLSGARVIDGDMVVEVCFTPATKATALARLREMVGATAVVFIGDDTTDEDAIRSLGAQDLGIKVGMGPSVARARVESVAEVREVLTRLLELRTQWLASRRLVPLERLSILSDQRTAVVVDPLGRVVWQCLPRIDSPSIFGSLLGGPSAGSFDIGSAAEGAAPTQAYDPDTMVLVTTWNGFSVTDYLDCTGGRAYQRAGRTDLIRVIEGSGRVRVRFAPRLDFGRAVSRLRVIEDGLEIDGSPDPLVLRSPGVVWTVVEDGPHQTAHAEIELRDVPLALELRWGSANAGPNILSEAVRREQTRRFWSGWARSLRVPALHAETVRRSSLVIKSMCHGPTGAIVAAATTSLPEHLGGVRNWDYRFCWPRDAALGAAALVRVGNTGHAMRLLDWVLGVVDRCETPDRLRPIYTVAGQELPPEAELGHMPGYGQSRPVRLSNAAAMQVQLDVFGPIVDLVALLAERGMPISPDHLRLVSAMVRAVEARWIEPDHGIWEIRADRRHHVHSKVMCWMTASRAVQVQRHVLGRSDAAWERLADAIRADVLERGWSERAKCFSSAYGTDHVDAATLWIGLSGLVSPTDPRFVATVEAVERHLVEGPVVRRYREHDGLPGGEGGMLICAGWLAEALHLIGRHEDARRMLDGLVGLLGPTGIAPEQYDTRHGIALGNIAQVYSHLAIINAAVALDQPAA